MEILIDPSTRSICTPHHNLGNPKDLMGYLDENCFLKAARTESILTNNEAVVGVNTNSKLSFVANK